MYNKNSFFSKKLTLLNSVLTFLIVLQHSAPLGRFGLNVSLEHPFIYCSIIFSYMSVPLFFFMSAALFYRKCEYSDLRRKLKSRVYSLLIPYLLWNTIFVIIYFTISRIPLIEQYMNAGRMIDSFQSFVIAILDSKFTPLWFIRDLMFYCILSPIILFVIKRIWLSVLILAIAIYVTLSGDFSHQSVVTWIPVYLSGALVGRYFTYKEDEEKGSTLRSVIKSGNIQILLAAGLSVAFGILYVLSVKDTYYLYWYRLLTPFIIWGLVDLVLFRYISEKFERQRWMGYTFFIYCTHFFVLNVLQKFAVIFIEQPTWWVLDIIFILSPVVTIVLLTYLANYLSRFRFYNYLSGKR